MTEPKDDCVVKMVPPESEIKKGGYQPSDESGYERGYRPQATVVTPIPPRGGTGTVAKPASSNSDAKKP